MNSKAVGETLNIASKVRGLQSILVVAVGYDVLLVAVGVALVGRGSDNIFPALTFAIIPGAIYAVGVFRYGRALFTSAELGQRSQAWWRLVRLSAVLFVATLTLDQLLTFSLDSYETVYGIPGQIWWTAVTAVLVGLIVLWACVSRRAFLQTSRLGVPGTKLSLALLAGSATVLASVALDVNYDVPGWSVLSWQGDSPTLYFARAGAATLPLKVLCLAGYAGGIVLAVLSVWAALRIMWNRPPMSRYIERLRDFGIAVFWFTITNYLCTFLLAFSIGVFLFEPKPALFIVINSAWLLMLVAGIVLWFNNHARTDKDTRRVQTLLLLWALPLVPFTISHFLDAISFFLFGLVTFVVGVFVLSACWWKMAEISTPRICSDPQPGATLKGFDESHPLNVLLGTEVRE